MSRTLYMVASPQHTDARLVVVSDSPEGAASFMQLRLRDGNAEDRDGPRAFRGTYLVHPVADDLGDGILVPSVDGPGGLDLLLRTTVPEREAEGPHWSSNPFVLWTEPFRVTL